MTWKQACAALPPAGLTVHGVWRSDLQARGVHGAIWEELLADPYEPPAGLPLTMASYCAKSPVKAYVEPVAVGSTLADVEEKLILSTLQQCETREGAARVLGISVKTLYNRMRLYRAH